MLDGIIDESTATNSHNNFVGRVSIAATGGVFYKKAGLKNFKKFKGKHLCQSLFFNNKTETLAQVFYSEFCEIFKNIFYTGHIFYIRLGLVHLSAYPYNFDNLDENVSLLASKSYAFSCFRNNCYSHYSSDDKQFSSSILSLFLYPYSFRNEQLLLGY